MATPNSLHNSKPDSSHKSGQSSEPNPAQKASPQAAHRKIPVQDFFRNPDYTRFTISPDGSQLAWLAPWKNRLNIHVAPANQPFDGQNENSRITSSQARDITLYIWKNKDCILYLQDFGGDENFHLFKVDVHTGNVIDLTPFDGVKVDLIDYRYDEPDQVFIQMNKRNPQLFDIYKLKISTAELTLLEENPGNISSWIVDHNGEVRAAITTDGTNTSLIYREKIDQDFKTVLTTNFRDSVEPQFFTFDNKALVALSNRGRNTSAAVILNLESGEETLIYENPEYDCMGVGHSRLRKKITSVLYVDWKLQRHITDSQTSNWLEKLNIHLNDFHFRIESITDDENIVVVRARSDVQPGAYYLYSILEDQLTFLTNVQSAHKPEELSKTQAIEFKSRDGLKIHGYLTLPAHCEAKNLPVVVNPHGGPWYRDTWDFNPEGLFLANQGIAVLRINFRGSTGYGKAFWEASFGQWGLKMQDDITDGVKWIIDNGIANPDKIGIFGGSYGGYATLAGLTFTPDLYCCGVDYVGVSNLFTFMETIPPYWKPYLDMMYEMVGHPEKDADRLKATSPVFHVDKIKAPLFVAQGARDPRVVKSESDQIVSALEEKGVPVKYMVKENEGHGFQNEENRFEFYEAMAAFFKLNLID